MEKWMMMNHQIMRAMELMASKRCKLSQDVSYEETKVKKLVKHSFRNTQGYKSV